MAYDILGLLTNVIGEREGLRETKLASKRAQTYIGLRAIWYHKKKHVEKIEMAKKYVIRAEKEH